VAVTGNYDAGFIIMALMQLLSALLLIWFAKAGAELMFLPSHSEVILGEPR